MLVRDGQVEELLPPGRQVAVGWLDRLASLFSDKVARTDFFLVDARPLPIPFTVDARSADGAAVTRFQVLVELRVQRDDRAALLRFLEQFGARDALSQKNLYDHLRPAVDAAMRPHLSALAGANPDLSRAATVIAQALTTGVAGAAGLDATAHITPVASSVSVDLQLGDAPAPAHKPCVKCGVELAASKKFCSACGEQQPIMSQTSRACRACAREVPAGKKFCTGCGEPFAEPSAEATGLFTKDGQQIELDLVLKAEGDRAAASASRVGPVVAAAAAKHLRRVDFSSLATAEGFRALEQALRSDVHAALRALGLTVAEVTVLDVRSKGGEWTLRARAELEQARTEILIGREWLAVEEQSLDLKVLGFDMALRNQRSERDHRFNLRRDEVADRKRHQALDDESADLDVADAQRDANRDVKLDAARRGRDRVVAAEDHQDRMTTDARDREAMRQRDRFNREDESAQAEHEMAVEQRVAAHDADLARQAMRLASERDRLAVDDQGYAARASADVDAYGVRTRGAAKVEVQRAEQDLAIDGEAKRQAMEMDKLRTLAELDAKIAEQERQTEAQRHGHELRMRQELKGLSTEQMLAMQASGQGGEAIAAALAEKFKAEASGGAAVTAMQREMYEKLLAQQAAMHQGGQQQMMQMVQMLQAQAMQNAQVLSNVATAAVGGKREAETARDAAAGAGAQRAIDMAERAMEGMARVAAATGAGGAARSEGQGERPANAGRTEARAEAKSAPRACPSCHAGVEPNDKVCGECGARL